MSWFKSGRVTVPSGIILGWPSTNASIPTGYTRATAYDGRFVKMVSTSATNPGGTGGASSHNHSFGTHQHSVAGHTHGGWSNSGQYASGSYATAGTSTIPVIHQFQTHGMTDSSWSGTSDAGGAGSWDTTSSDPPSLGVIFIKSDGTQGVPANAIAYFNAAAPTNFAEYVPGANRMWKGAAAGGDGGGTADTSSHSHTSGSHTHGLPAHVHTLTLSSSVTITTDSGAVVNRPDPSHTHTAGSSTSAGATSTGGATPGSGTGDTTPPWYKVLTIQNTSGVTQSPPKGLIAIWDGTLATIPGGWHLCDGTSNTPNLSNANYVRGASGSGEIGGTGGASSHTHAGASHGHTNGGATHQHNTVDATSSSTTPANLGAVGNTDNANSQDTGLAAHTHTITAGLSTGVAHGAITDAATGATGSATNDPTYMAVAYIQYTG